MLLLGLEVVAQVVLAVGQSEAGLGEVERVLVGVLSVVADAGADERAAEAGVRAGHQAGHVVVGLGLLHRVDVGLDRLGVELLDRGLVEERAVDGGDLRLVAAGLEVLVGGKALQDLVHAQLGQVAQHGEGAVARPVRRDLRRRGPLAVDVAEEVVAWLDGLVHRVEVDAPRAITLRGGGGGGGCRGRVSGARGGGEGRKHCEEGGCKDETAYFHSVFLSLSGRSVRGTMRQREIIRVSVEDGTLPVLERGNRHECLSSTDHA